jgi:outer membrane protein TolC
MKIRLPILWRVLPFATYLSALAFQFIPAATISSATNADALVVEALESNLEIRFYQAEIEVARQGLQIDLSKSDRWGDITFGPYMAGQQPGGKQIEGGLSLSIPLPLWNKNKGQIATETDRQQQAEATLRATLRHLDRDLA